LELHCLAHGVAYNDLKYLIVSYVSLPSVNVEFTQYLNPPSQNITVHDKQQLGNDETRGEGHDGDGDGDDSPRTHKIINQAMEFKMVN
jgi:hypothetical protein